MLKYLVEVSVVVVVCSMTACTLPESADDCQSIANDDSRLACLNQAMYGDVLRGSAIGAVGGAVVGGGVGALAGGPRGAAIGAASGALGGGIAGGAIAYLNYNRERSGGNPERMQEFAAADLQNENRNLRTLVAEYESRYTKSQDHVLQLQAELATPGGGPDRMAAIVAQLQHVLAKVEADRRGLAATADIEAKRIRERVEYNSLANDVASQPDLNAKEEEFHSLREQIAQRDKLIAILYRDLHRANSGLMAPGASGGSASGASPGS